MSGSNSDRPGSRHHDSRPGQAADRSEQIAVHDTFPASDPVGPTAATGSRAVPPERLMEGGQRPTPPGDAVTLSHRFRTAEAAKLAVEALVREGPIDRRCAEILPGDDAVTVKVEASGKDAARLDEMLRKQGGMTG
jgi:hypothetical protein